MVSAIQMDRFYGQLLFKVFNCGLDLIMNNIEYAYNVDNKILHKIGNDTKDQGNVACKTECVSFNRLLWNADDSVIKFMVSITSGVSLWYRFCYKNVLNYGTSTTINGWNLKQYKSRVLWL